MPSLVCNTPKGDLSLLLPKPFNIHPISAKTDYVAKGDIHKLWPCRTCGKLSYEQSGAVLKRVTSRGGHISTSGSAGCPPPVLVALETSCSSSPPAFWSLSLEFCCVIGDINGPDAPPGSLPPSQLSFPQVPTVDHVWMMSFNSSCYILKLSRKHTLGRHQGQGSSVQSEEGEGMYALKTVKKTIQMIQTTSESGFLDACDLTIHRHR